MTRREIIVELARTLPLVQGTQTTLNGHHGTQEARILQHTNAYHAGSYHQLETALALMANVPAGFQTRELRWHLTRRYLQVERKPQPVHHQNPGLIATTHGWQPATSPNSQPVGGIIVDPHGNRTLLVETWNPNVQPDQVEKALDWLELTLPRRLWLPDWDRLE